MFVHVRSSLVRPAAASLPCSRRPAAGLRLGGHSPAAGSAARSALELPGFARAASTRAVVYYQGPDVPASVVSTGRVGTYRNLEGSDQDFFGVDSRPTEVDVHDGRGKSFTLDENGFKLVRHPCSHVDYYNNQAVLDSYYSECERLVCRESGAKWALAFDHNVRAARRKERGEHLAGGSAVQEPLISYGVHNDYTAVSAPKRVKLLSQTSKQNDTLRSRVGSRPPIDPGRVEHLLQGRWLFINVWRNIAPEPVARFPLGLCDASTARAADLVVFEIRYADRVGENYFVRGSDRHRWYYFPQATRDEAVLLKCWDSRGKDFLHLMPGQPQDVSSSRVETVPATFSLHTGFHDLRTPDDAPDRESIEVRLVAFFEDP